MGTKRKNAMVVKGVRREMRRRMGARNLKRKERWGKEEVGIKSVQIEASLRLDRGPGAILAPRAKTVRSIPGLCWQNLAAS